MSRVVQPRGSRGSLKWIQRAVNERPSALNTPLLAALGGATAIEWLSPLAGDDFAEYRDAAFLERLGAGALASELSAFWPERGPQWDALARSDRGDLLLVEAKAHIPELFSPATQAGEISRPKIETALAATCATLGAEPQAPWSQTFFQLANRLAHLWFLRSRGQPAWLVLVNFVGDTDMHGPETAREWEAAYLVAAHVMGLPARHAFAKHVIHLYPHVADLG